MATVSAAGAPDLLAGASAWANQPGILAQLEYGGNPPAGRLPLRATVRKALGIMTGMATALLVVLVAWQVGTAPVRPAASTTNTAAPALPPAIAPATDSTMAAAATIISLPAAPPAAAPASVPATPAARAPARQQPPRKTPAAVPDHDVVLLAAMVAHGKLPAPPASDQATGRQALSR